MNLNNILDIALQMLYTDCDEKMHEIYDCVAGVQLCSFFCAVG